MDGTEKWMNKFFDMIPFDNGSVGMEEKTRIVLLEEIDLPDDAIYPSEWGK